jgi:hypothetical protein
MRAMSKNRGGDSSRKRGDSRSSRNLSKKKSVDKTRGESWNKLYDLNTNRKASPCNVESGLIQHFYA